MWFFEKNTSDQKRKQKHEAESPKGKAVERNSTEKKIES